MYSPINWYWLKSTGDVYSSASQSKMKTDDPFYVAWLAMGNLPTPWPRDPSGKESDAELTTVLAAAGVDAKLLPPIITVPQDVTLAQARAALMAANLFTKVDTFVKGSGNALAIMAWEYTNTVSRTGSLVKLLAPQLGMTDTDLDNLFIAAAKIIL